MFQRRKTRSDAGTKYLSDAMYISNNHRKYITLSKLGKDMMVTRLLKAMEYKDTTSNRKLLHKALKEKNTVLTYKLI